MKVKNMTLDEIKREGFKALIEKLGVVGALLFIRQFDKGQGDYTEEREKILKDLTLKQIVKEIENLKEKNK